MCFALLCLLLGCTPTADFDGIVDGDNGLVEFDITFDPTPPTAGPVVASIVLTDLATDAPITDAVVTVEPYMPAMGHGSGEVIVTEEGDGLYAAQWSFSMPGAWEVTVGVDDPDDQATVAVDVE